MRKDTDEDSKRDNNTDNSDAYDNDDETQKKRARQNKTTK